MTGWTEQSSQHGSSLTFILVRAILLLPVDSILALQAYRPSTGTATLQGTLIAIASMEFKYSATETHVPYGIREMPVIDQRCDLDCPDQLFAKSWTSTAWSLYDAMYVWTTGYALGRIR